MNNTNLGYVDPIKYDKVVSLCRDFFKLKGFIEVPTQSRLSILSACEDPETISTFNYPNAKGETVVFPLPQTGQMWLEYELLTHPEAKGFFCISTSYRNEPRPVAGRHNIIFNMIEFEFPGNFEDLVKFEKELLKHLGFEEPFHEGNYLDIAEEFGVTDIDHKAEMRLNKDYGNVFFLKNFPEYTSPFWNMKRASHGEEIGSPLKDTAKKVDVILHGIETIGSAERSIDRDDMRRRFETISDGKYAQILYDKFGKDRVEEEFTDFMKHTFTSRVGGGMGATRMIRAMELSGLL